MEPDIGTAPGIRKATADHNPVFPGFGAANEQTVPSDVKVRLVYATFRLAASALNPANIFAQAEEAAGGDYPIVQEADKGAGNTNEEFFNYFFAVRGGAKYQFGRSGNAGVTEENVRYAYIDLY